MTHSPLPWRLETGEVRDNPNEVWAQIIDAECGMVWYDCWDKHSMCRDLADMTLVVESVNEMHKLREFLKRPEERHSISGVANGVVVEKVIAEDGSLADVKITFQEETP